MRHPARLVAAFALALLSALAWTAPSAAQPSPQRPGDGRPGWVTAWAGSAQGPYPVGNPSAQPDMRAALPSAETGARDQSFRLVVRPTVWAPQARLRLSNAFGTRPVTFDGVYAGLQLGAAAVVPGTNRPVLFDGRPAVTVPPGGHVWSDPVELPFVRRAGDSDPLGRKLAVSVHVAGESGPMTWHAKALQTSYLTPPGAGSKGAEEAEAAFPYSTASWFFLDAVDMAAPGTKAVVALGDSITDGTASTMNGDDRWPDVLARRLLAAGRTDLAVVNAGIGGNQVVGPADYGPHKPAAGGPSALHRLERDVLGLSGVGAVIWLEGINDFSKNGGATADAVSAGMTEGVGRLRAAVPGVRVIGATLTSALGNPGPAHGSPEQDEKRRALNAFIRTSGLFDAVADFDAATLDPATGGLRAEFVPDSTTGGPGDKLHPNRAGYQAMGHAVDLGALPERALPGRATP